MFNKKISKIVNKLRITKIKCNKNTKNATYEKNNDKQEINNGLYNRIIYFFIIFPILTFISLIMICFVQIELYPISFNYQKYTIGEKVTLLNNMEGYCIFNCEEESRKITLLNLNVLDINDDNTIDENDMISFDASNNLRFDSNIKDNIAYILKEKSKQYNTKYRLMTSEEYVSIRKIMNFGYDWDDGNWLANEEIGSWWINSLKGSNVVAVSKRGSYTLYKPYEKNYIRPVIDTYKDFIK